MKQRMFGAIALVVGLSAENPVQSSASEILKLERKMHISFMGLSIPPNTTSVGNASDFHLLHNLLRPLISYGEGADLFGNAAERWTFDKDYRIFEFQLRSDLRFSNGEQVTAKDAVATIQRLRKVGKTIHYDFSKISSLETTSPFSFRLSLSVPDRNLVTAIKSPEFSPLHHTDYESDRPQFKVTTGPYFIKEIKGGKILLQENPFFLEKLKDAPSTLEVDSFTEQVEYFTRPDFPHVDFFSASKISQEEHKMLVNKYGFKVRRVNLGFTHFLSLNPNRNVFAKVENRQWVQRLLKPSEADLVPYDPFLVKALQLYLPDGPGRLKEPQLKEIWNNTRSLSRPTSLPKGTKLEVLVRSTFALKADVLKKLKENAFDVSVTEFKTWSQYAEIIQKKSFDLVYANNDFSAPDVLENLRVTFNPGRPLIFLPSKENPVDQAMKRALQADDAADRYKAFEAIEYTLLSDAYIVPMYHEFLHAYHKPHVDLARWSSTIPEMPFWRTLLTKP